MSRYKRGIILVMLPVIALAYSGCKTAERVDRGAAGNQGFLIGTPSAAEEPVESEVAEIVVAEDVGEPAEAVTVKEGSAEERKAARHEIIEKRREYLEEKAAGETAGQVEEEILPGEKPVEVASEPTEEAIVEEAGESGAPETFEEAAEVKTAGEGILTVAQAPAEILGAAEETEAETNEGPVAELAKEVVEQPSEGEVVEEPAAEEAPAGEREPDEGIVTMDFKDADINNVLRILAQKGNVNIIAGPEVSGKVTIRLTDVPWEKALSVVLRTYGFTYEREGNIIRVTTLDKLKEEEVATEVFTLNYAKAEEVVESITEMLTDRGRVKHDARTNLIIVTDVPTNVYQIGQVIQRLDRRTPQVLIEAKVVETTLGDTDELGIDWTVMAEATGATRPTTFPFNREGSPFNKGENYYPLGDPDDSVGFPTSAVPALPYTGSTAFTFGKLDFDATQAVLKALKSRTDTNIISNPRITTLNNQEARILVGTEVLIPVYERVEGTVSASMEITGYEYREVGIRLLVTPHVNENGDIVLDLNPSVSEQLDYDQLTAEIKVPKFSAREAQTQVMIRDGETIVIGGLLKNKTVDKETKVPLLGDIPLLGYVFRKTTKTVDKVDLIFFVTAYIVAEENLDSGTARD